MNAAAPARVVTSIRKFDRGLYQILYDELHWLDVPDRAFFKLAVTVHRCLNGRTPPYLSDTSVLTKAFTVYVLSLLEYCSSVWPPSTVGNINKLESV